MKVFILTTQWKDNEPEVSGVFSSFDKAVMYFVRTQYKDTAMSVCEMQAACARTALKLAHKTDDEDYADFGSTRAWVDEHVVDECCEDFEKEAESSDVATEQFLSGVDTALNLAIKRGIVPYDPDPKMTAVNYVRKYGPFRQEWLSEPALDLVARPLFAALDYVAGATEFADSRRSPRPTRVIKELGLTHDDVEAILEWRRRRIG